MSGIEEGANNPVANVLNKAEVGTLIPGSTDPPVLTIAVTGIVPGAKTYDGNVLNNDAVGTLTNTVAFAIRDPPCILTPVVVLISIAY